MTAYHTFLLEDTLSSIQSRWYTAQDQNKLRVYRNRNTLALIEALDCFNYWISYKGFTILERCCIILGWAWESDRLHSKCPHVGDHIYADVQLFVCLSSSVDYLLITPNLMASNISFRTYALILRLRFLDMLQTWPVKLNEKREIKREIKREKKLTVTQGGTQTHDLTNGLPCSSQLSYWVTRQLSGWIIFKYLHVRLSCQGSTQSGYQAGMSDGGCGEREARGAGSDLTVRS